MGVASFRGSVLVAIGTGLVGALLGCERVPVRAPRPNVIVVLVDTLRAQNLGVYGYDRPTSPTFDALAAGPGATLFRNAQSQAPCTFPSANSLLTGRVPARFVSQPERAMGIPAEIPSLATILAANGYDTAAISTSPIVRATPGKMNPTGGFGAGFRVFQEDCVWRGAACVNQAALAQLPELQEPFLLYLHYLDPHGPYRPPANWPRKFASADYEGREAVTTGDPLPFARRMYDEGLDSGLSASELQHLVDLYDDEIASFDASFGNLLGVWRSSGLLDRTLLVVMADHGEHFLEHGHLKHCRSLYDVEIKTPLLVREPGLTRLAREDLQAVGNISLVPTVLDWLGIDRTGYQFDGPSVLPLLRGEAIEPEPVMAAWGVFRSVRLGQHKLIQNLQTGDFELFDLAADPGEITNLAADLPEQARALRRLLSVWLRQHEGDRAGAANDEVAAHLRALGYL